MRKMHFFQSILDLFLPPLCLHCGSRLFSAKFLCPQCREKVKILEGNICKICSIPVNTGQRICKNCRKQKPPFEKIISLFTYQEPVETLIKEFKYNFLFSLEEFFKDFIIDKINIFKKLNIDTITFIPMHPQKLKEREYNPAYLIGKWLSEILNIKLEQLLITTKFYPPQVSLNLEERYENVKGIFRAKHNNLKENILIVDDVITTTSTIREACKVLKENGAKHIFAFSLARSVLN